ncbi:hypothetical protein PFICI_05715 [Pestalotiopsis fici W106-1]|uniref:Uncharacterized protein n=1 Tax=Pestalotiopsis fici (strain W106-1 / CGMCC3.15140) TaxID=1229662 RepID=W3XCV3_PESFW|nr:uncharacterized protein PFICI_05715 [Pestalotiopsis fici W106-1]ETS83839.1 hypothetical protein PFICI_05715 [Pestalotiopsis fici W106-1]
MRQLQQPLKTRLIIAAAAWRPRLLFSLPVRGSIRWQSSTTTTTALENNPEAEAAVATATVGHEPAQASSSFFAALFPDEAKHRVRREQTWAQSREPGGSSISNHDLDSSYPPPQTQSSSPLQQSERPLITYYENSSHHPRAASELRCTVVLAAASKNLAASDFFRVGAGRAAHVEGWVGGITKVVQARDPDTLEPLGRYYVTFGTAAAAAAWREEVKRLWELSRAYTPGVMRSRAYPATGNFGGAGIPVRVRGIDGTPAQLESTRREVQTFTLVPPDLRWSLDVAHYTPEERAMEIAGSLVEKLCRKAGTRFLVMVAVNGGRISPETLRASIRDDNEERGLPWRVKNLDTLVGGGKDGEWGIMPFGKSDAKALPGVTQEESLQQQAASATSGADRTDKVRSETRRYPRFLVPFADEAEARRFVRHWHRRQLTLRMGHEDANDQTLTEWEEARVLDVTYLW